MAERGRRERGSALVLALLVTFILALLGTSFLLMAQTESRIAHNEKLAAQARYVAEAGVLVVKGWFDRPGAALGFPTPAEVDRTQRLILDPADPYGASAGNSPLYREGVDLDGDGADDLFARPYRGADELALMGSIDAPDLVIDDESSDAERDFLVALTSTLIGVFPREGTNLTARLSRIAVYAPPYIESGVQWTRMGVASVRVTGRIYNRLTGQVVAQQTVTVVLNEIPYSTPILGPLHAGGRLTLDGRIPVHWGTITAVDTVELQGFVNDPDELTVLPEAVPRLIPSGARADPIRMASNYYTVCGGRDIPDPWLRLIAGREILGPDPFNTAPDPLATWQPWKVAGADCDDWSGVIAEHPLVSQPRYDYRFWKRLARSGGSDVHYYVPEGGGFREQGVGPTLSFQEITHGANGLFFFDTVDGREPHDDDFDGSADNLSPVISVSGDWSARGFFFVNAERIAFSGLAPGTVQTMRAPREPYVDVDANGAFNSPDPWINFVYPASLSAQFVIDDNDGYLDDPALPPGPMRNRRGPPIGAALNLHGILIAGGELSLAGPQGRMFGGLVALGEVDVDGDSFFSGEGVFWDDSIGDGWPPPELRLPRVAITRWDYGP